MPIQLETSFTETEEVQAKQFMTVRSLYFEDVDSYAKYGGLDLDIRI